jgi:mono/diheme cytochrome c family protein
MRARLVPAAGAALGALLAYAGLAPAQQAPPPTTAPVPTAPAAATDLVERGRYLAAAGDCIDCHTPPGGTPYAGGRPLQTPFGTIYSMNITPKAIGHWTADQFYRTLHEGVDPDGYRLYPAFPYPAFPYPYFTKLTRADSDALFAYLKSVPPADSPPGETSLPFPFNIRALMLFWNLLFLHKGEYQPDPGQSEEWNRGAYLVQGAGHCGACHTPKNLLGADVRSRAFQGGRLENWWSSDLTGNERRGLGSWSAEELVEYLKTGRNARSAATGPMADVIMFSTSKMTDADLRAIATYLKSLPASEAKTPEAPAQAIVKAGEAIFTDSCSACHHMDGTGEPRFFPPLGHNANVQQADATTLIRIILNGTRSAPTDARPTPLAMPAYDWKLNDKEVAAVATFLRSSWGNQAAPVSAEDVAKVRKSTAVAEGKGR